MISIKCSHCNDSIKDLGGDSFEAPPFLFILQPFCHNMITGLKHRNKSCSVQDVSADIRDITSKV